jgi:hypothetical protein
VSDPTPRLRRDPNPNPKNGRRAVIGAFVVFVLLVGFVLTLVITIGLHNNGVKLPPPDAFPSSSTPSP